jgi:hypothetical protein
VSRSPHGGRVAPALQRVWLALLLTLCCSLGAATAQDEDVVEVEGFVERPPATVMVGLHGGLPGYRNVGVGAAIKADQFGVALRGGWGTVGASFGVQGRWYPPLPAPLPFYVGLGVDAYAGNATPHAVIGAHAPLSPAWRLDLEGGVARATLAGTTVWAPHLSVGVSYAFTFDLDAPEPVDGDAAATARPGSRGPFGARCEPGPPDPGALTAAVAASVQSFVRDGVALYGNAYRDLRYRYAIVRREVAADDAVVDIRYSGSARAVVGGETVEAAGVAQARFTWSGCTWRLRDLSY